MQPKVVHARSIYKLMCLPVFCQVCDSPAADRHHRVLHMAHPEPKPRRRVDLGHVHGRRRLVRLVMGPQPAPEAEPHQACPGPRRHQRPARVHQVQLQSPRHRRLPHHRRPGRRTHTVHGELRALHPRHRLPGREVRLLPLRRRRHVGPLRSDAPSCKLRQAMGAVLPEAWRRAESAGELLRSEEEAAVHRKHAGGVHE